MHIDNDEISLLMTNPYKPRRRALKPNRLAEASYSSNDVMDQMMRQTQCTANRRRVAGLVAVALVACGCAPLTEVQLENREYRRVEHIERFRAFRADCQARGKRVLIDAISQLPRDGMPGRGDRYFCG